MKGTYWQKGEVLDYLNRTEKKIENGDVVVLGNRIGVAGDDILPGAIGAIHVTGVFKMKKADAGEIAAGTEVYFTEDGITTTDSIEEGANVKAGYAAEVSLADNPTVYVKINA